ncbi:MAG: helix-turn-helix transcriptional regulator [Oscillospiraceae bacterium]|nr:helix-turn-helix transcriptional regulator [Oscillospiraceae bacterium]
MFKIKATDGTNNLCGRRIAEIRKGKNLSQRKLAIKMQLLGFDVDHYFIRRVENGERFVTDIDLVIFSKALDVPITEILSDAEEYLSANENKNS